MTTKRRTSNWDKKIGKDTKRQQREASSFGYLNLPKDVKMFSPEPEGRVQLDFLPYDVIDPHHPDRDPDEDIAMPGTLWWKRPYKTHRNIGSEDSTVVCLTSIGKKCPVCEYRAKQIKDEVEKDVTDALKPSSRNLYIVIPLNSKKHDVKIHVFDISLWNFQKLLNKELDERVENRNFPDLEKGKTLDVRFEATTFAGSKPFPNANRIDFLPREDTYDESILDKVPNLDEILTILSYEELSNKLFGFDDDDGDNGGTLKDADKDDKKEERSTERRKNPLATGSKKEEEKEKEKEPDKKVKDEKEKSDIPNWEELQTLTGRKLSRFCDDHKLKLDPDKYEEDDDLRKAVAEELDIEMPEGRSRRTPSAEKEKEKSEKSSTKDEGKENKCPHDHKFGEETSKYKDCDDCTIWDDCDEENLKQKKS